MQNLFPKFYPCYTISFIILIRSAWKQFIRTHKGPFKEKLTWNTDFPVRMKSAHLLHCITRIFHNLFFSALKCLRQEPGNNLCGYYICEHMHSFTGPKGLKMTPHNFKVRKIKLLLVNYFLAPYMYLFM